MKINDIVTSIEISNQLRIAGYVKSAIFSYFKDKYGEIYVAETDFAKDELIAFAYTSSELIESLPFSLSISTETFVVNSKTYTNITKEEIEKYHWADLEMMKFTHDDESSDYITKYSIGGRMIAFSRSLKGEYNNLIRFGKNEAESRAKMILALIEDDKL